MSLKVQVISFIFSFLYGCILFILFRLQKRVLFSRNKKKRVILSFIFCISISIVYFILIYFINNGVLHLYFLLLIIFGFLVTHNFLKKCVK